RGAEAGGELAQAVRGLVELDVVEQDDALGVAGVAGGVGRGEGAEREGADRDEVAGAAAEVVEIDAAGAADLEDGLQANGIDAQVGGAGALEQGGEDLAEGAVERGEARGL